MKTRFFLLLVSLIFSLTFCGSLAEDAPAPTPAPTVTPSPDTVLLQKGDTGDELYKMKYRLYELGYFSSTNFSKKYNDVTVKAVESFQETNGLPVTGVYTQKDANVLFSADAVPYTVPTPVPAESEALPTVRPLLDPQAPERDAEGFLPEGSEEYFYENEEEGQWCYLSDGISILINRYRRIKPALVWFETDIRFRNGNSLIPVELSPDNPGHKFNYPADICAENNFVLGFTDDFYGHRIYYRQTPGIIIRNGEIIRKQTAKKRVDNAWPNLDMMAQFQDGSLKCYPCGSITAEELVELGAVNVFSFGPIIITDGAIDPITESRTYDYKNPRQFLGMIEPNHYLIMTVTGRVDDSEGIGMLDAAAMMLQRGCSEALNLDGGNTMALVFRGKMLNKLATYKNKKYIRTVSSLIGVGISENAIPPEDSD